jgi:ChrR Cupin-like domain
MKNNLSFLQEYAADYVFGILEAPEEFTIESTNSITADASEAIELQTDLQALQIAVGNLAYGVQLLFLPIELKSKLLARVHRINIKPADLSELLTWPIADLRQVAKDLTLWEPFPFIAGSEQVIWQVDHFHAQVAFFLRIPAIGQIPAHSHTTKESILVLEGNLINDGIVYEVGSLYETAANTTHQPYTSLGCLILSITSEPSDSCPSKQIVLI